MNTVQIANNSNYHRDMKSHAVININNSEYEAYMRQKKLIEDAKLAATEQKNTIQMLERDISELRQMVQQLLNKESNGSRT